MVEAAVVLVFLVAESIVVQPKQLGLRLAL